MNTHMRLKFFIIRSKMSGWYLPPGSGRGGRGATHQKLIEPSSMFPPRLFHTERAAQISLTWWLKGATSVISSGSISIDFNDYELLVTQPQPDRWLEHMEVARVELII
jgi:hypothetical protein